MGSFILTLPGNKDDLFGRHQKKLNKDTDDIYLLLSTADDHTGIGQDGIYYAEENNYENPDMDDINWA